MTEATQAAIAEKREEKEADHHPYYRPKDAATLILVDRSAAIPKVLVGRRHDKVVFMPGKFVFPGGRVDKSDSRVPVAAPIPKALEANLLKGSPKITPTRARALAIAAIREACEETGLCLGRNSNAAVPALEGAWKPFTEAGLLPDPSGLFLIARAITPPGRVRRFGAKAAVGSPAGRAPESWVPCSPRIVRESGQLCAGGFQRNQQRLERPARNGLRE